MGYFTHGYLPHEIRTTAALLRQLDGSCKNRLLESISLYGKEQGQIHDPVFPDERIRFNARNVSIRWHREQWHNLYVYRIDKKNGGLCLFVFYHPDAIWLYRGTFQVEADIFGDQCVACHDALRFSVPIWSKFSVDSRSQLTENTLTG